MLAWIKELCLLRLLQRFDCFTTPLKPQLRKIKAYNDAEIIKLWTYKCTKLWKSVFFFSFVPCVWKSFKQHLSRSIKTVWQASLNNLLTICGINGVLYQSSTNFSKQTKPFKVLNFKTYNASQKIKRNKRIVVYNRVGLRFEFGKS